MTHYSKRLFVGIFFILLLTNNALAFELTGASWLQGEATFNVNFAQSDPNLSQSDQNAFQSAFVEAANFWNNNSTFNYNIDQTSAVEPCSQPPGSTLNGVLFSDTVCGTSFGGSTLAVARTFSSGGNTVRTGIIFNSAINWSVYNGNLQFFSEDFRRVAVHELGHSLGLDHESDVPAIMAPSVGSIEEPQADDINGVAALYDPDGDGVGKFEDNCPSVANANQADSNENGIGDVCEVIAENEEFCFPIIAAKNKMALVCF